MSNGKSSTRRNVVYETSASFKVAQLMSHFAILLKLPSFKSYFPRHGTHLVSLQFSCSVMSGSLQPHGLQHARLPCPSQTPRVYSNACPSTWWCHPTISSSVIPFSSCPQSFPASGSQFFPSDDQSIGVSASTFAHPMNIQDWFPLGLTDLISLQSKGLSRAFSNTTVQKQQFFGAQLFL